jgi:hypothetical protein
MLNTVAIVHAPDVDKPELRILLKKLEVFVERMKFFQSQTRINASHEIDMNLIGNPSLPMTLIIGWGKVDKPDWSGLEYAIKTSSAIRVFIAIDLFETLGEHGRVLMVPNLKYGRYWQRKTWQIKCKHFLKGSYISCFVPYGMRRMPFLDGYNENFALSSHYTLVPGAAHEIEIVRLIFDLYANHGYTLTDLANLLNAQRVTPPYNGKAWNPRKIKTIIASPVYIGSNQFGVCMKHNVFPALIDRSTFCTAQYRIYRK